MTADAGGQRSVREGDVLVGALEDDTAYAAAILRATRRPSQPAIDARSSALPRHAVDVRPQARRTCSHRQLEYRRGAALAHKSGYAPWPRRLCRRPQSSHVRWLPSHLAEADVPTFFFGLGQSFENRTFEVLSFLRNARIGQLVFWNVDAPASSARKALAPRRCVIEVSPGPMLFRELDQTGELQHALRSTLPIIFAASTGSSPSMAAARRGTMALIPRMSRPSTMACHFPTRRSCH